MLKYERQINQITPRWVSTESGGNPNARSSAGAMGLLQLMPGTARDLGVKNPYDPQENLSAGKQYLDGLLQKYGGDLPTALMAYHAGSGNVDKYLKGEKSGVGAFTKAYPGKVLGQSLADAGFKPMRQRPQPTEDKFPITLIPGVEPQPPIKEATDMAVVQQPQTGNIVDFSKQQKDINQSKLLAKVLSNVDWGDPNQQVSGRAVAMSPITLIAKTLQQGLGNRELANAQEAEDSLAANKAKDLQELAASGQLTPEMLLSHGHTDAKDYAKALISRQQQAEFQFLPGVDGYGVGNKATGEIKQSDFKSPIYDALTQAALMRAKEGEKISQINTVGANGEVAPQVMTNNQAMGMQPPQRFDQPTSMMPVPNSAPMQATARIASPAAIAAETEAAKGAAGLPLDVEKQRQIEEIKTNEAIRQKEATDRNKKQLDLEIPDRKDIPPTHKMVYVENNKSLKAIDDAIAEVKKNPKAFGYQNALGDTISQRLDPKGVGSRASVMGVSAIKRHDISGAAIAASEAPNLVPFIPSTSDTPDAIIDKLTKMKGEFQSVNDQIGQMYSPVEGYGKLPELAAPPAKKPSKEMSDDELLNHYGQ